ncbi:amidohydrolase family protein [Pseudoxanthomonas sp.]|uniref:amidohydrolase family protein n=1 Tax=Pseudoxanthomonas sp. TaxID=1871049 RepID=UPI00261196E7|nr:amidohydrolase family protein [Pseudoxanthomonas sp.]WDS36933.1 MAG: amidohydrolase family protein [Pseudoxanthomonas sp.]
MVETALEPDLPIIDAHHHVWVGEPFGHFELYDPEWLYADLQTSGHNVVKTLYVDSHSGYREDGPEALRVVGETEFADDIANEAVRRGGKSAGACATIVASADLMLGTAVGEVLDAHLATSPRFRGIRHMTAYVDEMPPLFPGAVGGMMLSSEFRKGFTELAARDLVFDSFLLAPQLPELTDLARQFPDTRIVLDHVGGPMVIGRYDGRLDEAFADWKRDMAELAKAPNVSVKLGGLNMGIAGVDALAREQPFSSEEMVQAQRDYLLTTIDLFGPARCMFESNFPVDMYGISYTVVWNGFKRLTAGFSPEERTQLFSGTAARVYRVDA